MGDPVDEMKATLELAAFKAAKTSLKEKRYASAAEQLGNLLEALVGEQGDLAAALAPVYYEYGNALLMQVESNSNVFGESVKTGGDGHGDDDGQGEHANGGPSAQAAEGGAQEAPDHPPQAGEGEPSDETKEEAGAESMLDEVMNQLIDEYVAKTGKDPTEEVLKQWKETLAGANLAALASDIGKAQGATSEPADEGNDEAGVGAAAAEADDEPAEDAAAAKTCTDAPEVSEEQVLGGEDLEELMNIAWEVLETGRVLLTRTEESCKNEDDLVFLRKQLALTYLRLADLSMERGLFEQSILDYETSLEKHRQVFSPHSCEIAEVYTLLATSHLFAASNATDTKGMRDHQLKAMRSYVLAIFALAANRRAILGEGDMGKEPNLFPSEEDEVAEPVRRDTAGDEDEDEVEDSSAAKGKSKAKAAVLPAAPAEGEEPPLSPSEEAQLRAAKAGLAAILEGLPTEEQLAVDDSKETTETRSRLQFIEDLKLKVDDIILVLENREASQAIQGAAAGVVEEGIESAQAEASNPFDKPTSMASDSAAAGGPTNLLQVRKKAGAPAANGAKGEAAQADQPNEVQTKRKIDLAAGETESAEPKRVKET